MSKFVMEMDLGNAVFHDDNGDFDPGPELFRILKDVATKAKAGYFHGNCTDANGNHIGTWEVRE